MLYSKNSYIQYGVAFVRFKIINVNLPTISYATQLHTLPQKNDQKNDHVTRSVTRNVRNK